MMSDSSGVVAPHAGSITDGNIQKGNGPRERAATEERERSPSMADHRNLMYLHWGAPPLPTKKTPCSSCNNEEVSALRRKCDVLEERCRANEEKLERLESTLEELRSTKEDLAKVQKLLATAPARYSSTLTTPRCSSIMEKLAAVQAEVVALDAQMQNSDRIFEWIRLEEEGTTSDHTEANGQIGIEEALRKEIEQLRAENDSLRMNTPSHPWLPLPPPPPSSAASQPTRPNSQFVFGKTQKPWMNVEQHELHEMMMGLLHGREGPPVTNDYRVTEWLMSRMRTIASKITERDKIEKVTLELGYQALTCQTCGTYLSDGQMFLTHVSSKEHMDLLKHPQYTSDVTNVFTKAARCKSM